MLIGLQRTVGNQAVRQLISASPPALVQRYSPDQRRRFAGIKDEVTAALTYLTEPARVEATWRQLDDLWLRIAALDSELRGDADAEADQSQLYGFKTQIADAISRQLPKVDMFNGGFAEKKIAELREQLNRLAARWSPAEAEFKRAGGPGRVAFEAYKLRDKLTWMSGAGGDADRRSAFHAWLKSDKDNLPLPAKALLPMNCWEAVFYAAVSAGIVKKAALKEIYESADLDSELEKALGFRSGVTLERTIARGSGLKPGSILIFGEPSNHVAIALGGKRAMSLWSKPGPRATMMAVDVDTLAQAAGVRLSDEVYVVEDCPLFSGAAGGATGSTGSTGSKAAGAGKSGTT